MRDSRAVGQASTGANNKENKPSKGQKNAPVQHRSPATVTQNGTLHSTDGAKLPSIKSCSVLNTNSTIVVQVKKFNLRVHKQPTPPNPTKILSIHNSHQEKSPAPSANAKLTLDTSNPCHSIGQTSAMGTRGYDSNNPYEMATIASATQQPQKEAINAKNPKLPKN